jgi:hypothetical protein
MQAPEKPARCSLPRLAALALTALAAAGCLGYVLWPLLAVPQAADSWPEPRRAWSLLYTTAIWITAALGLAALALMSWAAMSMPGWRGRRSPAGTAARGAAAAPASACDPFASTLPENRVVTGSPAPAARRPGGRADAPRSHAADKPHPPAPGELAPLQPDEDPLAANLRRMIAGGARQLRHEAADLEANCLDLSALTDSTLRTAEHLAARAAALRSRIDAAAKTARTLEARWAQVQGLLCGPTEAAPAGALPAQLASLCARSVADLVAAQREHADAMRDIEAAAAELAAGAASVNRMTSAQVTYGKFGAHASAGLSALAQRLGGDIERLHEAR